MATMRNSPIAVKKLAVVALFVSCSVAANNDFSPTIETGFYQLKQKDDVTDLTSSVFNIKPTASFVHASRNAKTTVNLELQSLFYEGDKQSDLNLFSYSIDNSSRYWGDSLELRLGFRQAHDLPSSGQANQGRDEINSPDKISKQNSSQVALNYHDDIAPWLSSSWAISVFNGRAERSSSYLIDPTSPAVDRSSLSNSLKTMSFDLNSRDRRRNFFWGIEGTTQSTSREQFEDIENTNLGLVVGVPFFYTIKMIGQAHVERSDGFSSTNVNSLLYSAQNYRSVGGGLEWQFGQQSYWNVTYNTLRNGKEEKAYVATAFDIKPSRRSSISGRLDRRFFGRSVELTGQYAVRSLRMKLSGSDAVGSLLALSAADSITSLFVCPPGASPSIDNCYQPPTANYVPQPGESYYNMTKPGTEFSEFGVIRRTIDYNLGYDFQRLNLDLQVGKRRDTYIERDAKRDENFANITASWALQSHIDLLLNYAHTNTESDDKSLNEYTDFTGISNMWSLSVKQQLSSRLNSTWLFSRVNNDFHSTVYRYEENRAALQFSYSFH